MRTQGQLLEEDRPTPVPPLQQLLGYFLEDRGISLSVAGEEDTERCASVDLPHRYIPYPNLREALLGSGGFGVVYRVWDQVDQRTRVVKAIPKAKVTNWRLLEFLCNEIWFHQSQIAENKFVHPCIPRATALFHSEQRIFIAFVDVAERCFLHGPAAAGEEAASEDAAVILRRIRGIYKQYCPERIGEAVTVRDAVMERLREALGGDRGTERTAEVLAQDAERITLVDNEGSESMNEDQDCQPTVTENHAPVRVDEVNLNRAQMIEEELHQLAVKLSAPHGYTKPVLLKECEDLFSFIEKTFAFVPGKIHPEAGFKIVSDLLEAVLFLHTNGIAHRDIKPENVLVLQDWMSDSPAAVQAFLIDFGLISVDPDLQGHLAGLRQRGAEQFQPISLRTPIAGTPMYQAPGVLRLLIESRERQRENPWVAEVLVIPLAELQRADLWQCGATYFAILNGRLLVQKHQAQMNRLHLNYLKRERSYSGGTQLWVKTVCEGLLLLGSQQEPVTPAHLDGVLRPILRS